MFLFCHWGGKKKTNLLEWPGFFSLTFISLLYLFSVSNTKSKLNSKWVEKASAWLQQHLITLKKSVATNSIGVEYLVDYVVFVRHIVKSESTQKAKEDEIPNLSVSFSAFLCSYSFHFATYQPLPCDVFHLSLTKYAHSLLIWWFYSNPSF